MWMHGGETVGFGLYIYIGTYLNLEGCRELGLVLGVAHRALTDMCITDAISSNIQGHPLGTNTYQQEVVG
jgi:hypothetical protein